jgi:hypothetical protein
MDHLWDDSWSEERTRNLPQCHLVRENNPLQDNIPVTEE